MRNKKLIVANVGILLVTTVTGIGVAARSQVQTQETQRIRTIFFQQGVPIAERLLPEDEIVLVKQRQIDHVAQWATPPAQAQLANLMLRSAEAAAIFTVSDISGQFTEDESWIRTSMVAVPTEVLFAQASDIARRRPIRITWDEGGERNVDHRLVRAGASLKLQKGDSCLIFLLKDAAGSWHPMNPPLAIERGRLVDTTRASKSSGETEPLEGLKVGSVVRDIRRAAAARLKEALSPKP